MLWNSIDFIYYVILYYYGSEMLSYTSAYLLWINVWMLFSHILCPVIIYELIYPPMKTSYEVKSATLYVHSAVFSVSNNILRRPDAILSVRTVPVSPLETLVSSCISRTDFKRQILWPMSLRVFCDWRLTRLWNESTSRVFSWFVSQSDRYALTESRRDDLIR